MRTPADDDEMLEEEAPAGSATRALWAVVLVLAGLLLLVAVSVASVALLVPDAVSGECIRPQLVRPENCAPNLQE